MTTNHCFVRFECLYASLPFYFSLSLSLSLSRSLSLSLSLSLSHLPAHAHTHTRTRNQLCKLTFTCLRNKQTHCSSRLHIESLLGEITRRATREELMEEDEEEEEEEEVEHVLSLTRKSRAVEATCGSLPSSSVAMAMPSMSHSVSCCVDGPLTNCLCANSVEEPSSGPLRTSSGPLKTSSGLRVCTSVAEPSSGLLSVAEPSSNGVLPATASSDDISSSTEESRTVVALENTLLDTNTCDASVGVRTSSICHEDEVCCRGDEIGCHRDEVGCHGDEGGRHGDEPGCHGGVEMRIQACQSTLTQLSNGFSGEHVCVYLCIPLTYISMHAHM